MDEIQPPFFRALFDTAADALLVVDEQGRIALTNDACQRLLGYSHAELAGQPVELLVPQRFPGHTQERAGFMARPRPRSMGRGLALHARHRDGRDVPVDIPLTPVADGVQRWTSAPIRDLTGRAQGVDALRVHATALRSAANGVVITDHTGTVTWVNPAACAMTGDSAGELVGQHTRILKSGKHDPMFARRCGARSCAARPGLEPSSTGARMASCITRSRPSLRCSTMPVRFRTSSRSSRT